MATPVINAGRPSAYNVYVPNPEATGGLLVGYSRNTTDFPVNRYIEIFPVDKMVGLYASWTSRNAARVVSNTAAEYKWNDGEPRPPGLNNLESFAFLEYRTQRYAHTFTLGELTTDQMSFDLLMTQLRDMGQQCMTARTMLVQSALSAANWNNNSAYVNPTGAPGGSNTILSAGQDWSNGGDGLGSNAAPYIKRSIQYGVQAINLATIGVVRGKDLTLVVNPNTAQWMSSSGEIQAYVRSSPFAMSQMRGDVPNQNGEWGLPTRLYGVGIEVEDAVRVSTRYSANDQAGLSATLGYVMPNGVAYLLAKPGKLVGMAGSRSFSTIQAFFFRDEMTVETLYDVNDKRYNGSVITNYQPVVASTFSGFQFLNCSPLTQA